MKFKNLLLLSIVTASTFLGRAAYSQTNGEKPISGTYSGIAYQQIAGPNQIVQASYSYVTPTALGWHLLVMNREEDDVSVIVLELPKTSEQKPSLTINGKPYSDEVIGSFEGNADNSVVVLHQQLQSPVPLIRLDLSVH